MAYCRAFKSRELDCILSEFAYKYKYAVIILARGGSKELPRKNLALLAGKPLLQWAIDDAKMAGLKKIYVSTDDDEIASFAKSCGSKVIRRLPREANDTATTEDTLVAKRNGILSTNTGYITYIDATNDQLIFEIGDGTDEYSLTSTSTFTTVGWHHFAAVWDQDSAAGSELYIDGVADSATDTGTIGNIDAVSGTAVLTIGAESDSGNPFDGKEDEIRVYKRALSAAEIAALYNQGL